MRFIIRESGTQVSHNEAKQLASLGIEILVVQENASENLLCCNTSATLYKITKLGRDTFYLKKRNEELDEDFFHRNLAIEGDAIEPRLGSSVAGFLTHFLMIAAIYASLKRKSFTVKFNGWEHRIDQDSAAHIVSIAQDYRQSKTLPGKE